MVKESGRFEHMKSRYELMQDIFAHSKLRMVANQKKLVQLFNENPQRALHLTDLDVDKIMNVNIAFPVGYKEPVSDLEQQIQTKAMLSILKRQ
jgi:hypothetical protein